MFLDINKQIKTTKLDLDVLDDNSVKCNLADTLNKKSFRDLNDNDNEIEDVSSYHLYNYI